MRWLRSRRVWLFVLGGILFFVLGTILPVREWFFSIKNWLITLGPWAMPAFVLIYLLASILGLPNIVLILIAGTLFDLVRGVILVSLADTLGAIACFLIGRSVARQPLKRWMRKHQNLAQLDRAVGHKGWKILLLTRLSPLVPSNVLNYGFSCTKVNFWQYCFFSWLGMLPVIILYVYLAQFGTFMLSDKLTPSKLALQTVGLVITIGTALYTTRWARKALSLDDPLERSTQKSPKG